MKIGLGVAIFMDRFVEYLILLKSWRRMQALLIETIDQIFLIIRQMHKIIISEGNPKHFFMYPTAR